MIKYTLKYENYNGEQETGDFYFDLNRAEVAKLQLAKDDLRQWLRYQSDKNDKKELVDWIVEVILLAYGVKSPDGRKFEKTQAIKDNFEYSGAYASMFEKLITEAGEIEKFVDGIIAGKINSKDLLPQEANQAIRPYTQPVPLKPAIENSSPVSELTPEEFIMLQEHRKKQKQ